MVDKGPEVFFFPTLGEVPQDFLKGRKESALLLDVDQTFLGTLDRSLPSTSLRFLKKAREAKKRVLLYTNNTGRRVRPIAKEEGLPLLVLAFKPDLRRTLRFLHKEGLEPQDVLLFGDQFRTDYKTARRLRTSVVLLSLLSGKDNLWTRFHRKKDQAQIEKLRKKETL